MTRKSWSGRAKDLLRADAKTGAGPAVHTAWGGACSHRDFVKIQIYVRVKSQETRNQTLKRNSTTSPSFITYSLPSERTSPFSLAAAMLPHSIRSL